MKIESICKQMVSLRLRFPNYDVVFGYNLPGDPEPNATIMEMPAHIDRKTMSIVIYYE